MNKALGDSFHFERAGLRLKNRAVLAPLTHNMSGADGDPAQAELDWLARCARGGFGLLIAAATQVQPGGRCWAGQPALMTDTQQQAFT
ncbi:NADH:flavin oxidoreductase, partial [Aeromonas dhakensis]